MSFFQNLAELTSGNFSILSFWFYLFFAVFAFLYYTVGKKLGLQWILLLFASLIFYFLNCSLKLFLFLLIPVFLSYLAALFVNRFEGRIRSACLWPIIVFDIAFLVFFKERNFFIITRNIFASAFNGESWGLVRIAAPLGISYLVLMLVSYVLDASWKTIEPQRNPLKFLLYVIYFPLVTSGPITRYTEVENQLFEKHGFDYEKTCFGLQRVVWGMFKKMVVADRVAIVVSSVYCDWNEYCGITLFAALMLYTIQLYCDFSGCIDVVLGISEVFGITLPENFRQPLFSTSLSEIWRRWHMTLGFWMKDYLLYPVLKSVCMQKFAAFLKTKLGKKNRYAKNLPTWCGMLILWFSVGFWHGGSWNYIFGGGLFFFVMIAGGQLLEPVFESLVKILHVNTEVASWRLFQRLRTFLLFAGAVSFQRAKSFTAGIEMWQKVFDFGHVMRGKLKPTGLDKYDFAVMIAGLFVILVVSNLEQKESVRKQLAAQNLVFRWGLYFAMIFSVLVFGMYGPGYSAKAFIYAGF